MKTTNQWKINVNIKQLFTAIINNLNKRHEMAVNYRLVYLATFLN